MSYSVIKADVQKDRHLILSVWERNFKDVPQERYRWFYENNPYGPASSWLVTDQKTNSVVGSTALFPRRMNLNGEKVLVGIAADFAVNREHRSLSPALKLQKAVISGCKENKAEFIYGFTNEQSQAVLLRAGYKKLGEVHRLAKLLRTKNKLKRYLPLPGTGLFSIPLDFILAIFSKEKSYAQSKDFKIESPKRFDERFDSLWEEAKCRFGVIGERNRQYLNWKYVDNPHKKYHIFSLAEQEGEKILGFVVFYLQGNNCFVADLLCANSDFALKSLLAQFIIFLRKEKIDSVSILILGPPSLVKNLKAFGFHSRKENSKVLIYIHGKSPHLPLVMNKENWFLLEGDRDI
jgi:hypothetical protein